MNSAIVSTADKFHQVSHSTIVRLMAPCVTVRTRTRPRRDVRIMARNMNEASHAGMMQV